MAVQWCPHESPAAPYLAARLRPWLINTTEGAAALALARADLAGLRAKVGGPGAASRAAQLILGDLASLGHHVHNHAPSNTPRAQE